MTPSDRGRVVKQLAAEVGLDVCGIAAAGPIARGDDLLAWLAAGRAGSMSYLQRHLESRLDPRALLPEARSVVVAGLSYRQSAPAPPDDRPRGRVAMYAWGDDYHEVVRDKLDRLVHELRRALAEPFAAKVCCDTSAIVERELAASAGVGWIGKNTLVLNERIGSFFVLGEILTSLELAPDEPVADHCGSCRRCLDACPTQAFPAAYQLDPRRCISYLTIEQRGQIDPALEGAIGDWVFGCDVCQQVCPFNRDSPATREPRFAIRPPGPHPALDEIDRWTKRTYNAATRGSATARARLSMWRRNAAIARRNVSAAHADREPADPSDAIRRPECRGGAARAGPPSSTQRRFPAG